jgi:hypothetical protein
MSVMSPLVVSITKVSTEPVGAGAPGGPWKFFTMKFPRSTTKYDWASPPELLGITASADAIFASALVMGALYSIEVGFGSPARVAALSAIDLI